MKTKILFLILIIFNLPSFSQTFEKLSCNNFHGVMWTSCDWADMDNDGDLDILASGADDDGVTPVTAVYRNEGNDRFIMDTVSSLFHLAWGKGSARWGDYNNDGYADFAVSGRDTAGAKTKLFKNINGSYFVEEPTYMVGVHLGTLSWVDYDIDGDIDLHITGNPDSMALISIIYENHGNGAFSLNDTTGMAGFTESTAAWGDYDGDGYPDVAIVGIANGSSLETKLYRNNHNKTFTEATTLPDDLLDFRDGRADWGDYDHDGDLDLIMGGNPGFGYGYNYLYKNNGGNTFVLQPNSFPRLNRGSTSWADLNNDTYLDLIFCGEDAFMHNVTKIYINNTSGNFIELSGTTFDGVSIGEVVAGDYDNDGDNDLLLGGINYDVTSGNVSVFENKYIDTQVYVPYSIAQNGSTLQCTSSASAYRWLSCPSYTVISGETGSTFMPDSSGSYAVELTFGPCIDTSLCFNYVHTIGINQNEKSFLKNTLYPNPTKGPLSHDLGKKFSSVHVSLTSIDGTTLENKIFYDVERIDLSLGSYAKGLYFIQISTPEKRYTLKAVKE